MDWSPVGGRFPHSSTILPAGREGESDVEKDPAGSKVGSGGVGRPDSRRIGLRCPPHLPPEGQGWTVLGIRRKEGDYSRSVGLEGWGARTRFRVEGEAFSRLRLGTLRY
eukprot:scaffold397_cov395-Pavlova_lutheri.AAC.14